MAASKCPSCSGTSFQAKEQTVSGYTSKLGFIQCASCGAVVGVMPVFDPGVLAKENQALLVKMQKQLTNLEAVLETILRQARH